MEIMEHGEVEGEIVAPSSKSYTHRALFLALLGDGHSIIHNPLICEDTERTIDVIKRFGAVVEGEKVIPPERLLPNTFFAGESGTTARITVALTSLPDGISVVDGGRRLRERPFYSLIKALKTIGVEIEGETLPVKVRGGLMKHHKHVKIDAKQSSQFVTSLLILASKVGMVVEPVNPVSKPYINMTLRTMKYFGVRYRVEDGKFVVERGVKGGNFSVPGDYSNASFFLAAGALFGRIKVKNLQANDVQADMKILDILRDFGAKVVEGNDYVEVEADGAEPLHIDCSDFPDLFPVLSVLATYADGKSIITARQLRFKESDRIHAMAVNLARMGIKVKELSNGLEIHGGKPKGITVETFGDHRIAMAMSIAAIGARGKTVMPDSKCVKKSYPDFFRDLRRVVNVG